MRPVSRRALRVSTLIPCFLALASPAIAGASGWTVNPGVWLTAPMSSDSTTSETSSRTDSDGDLTVDTSDDENSDEMRGLSLQVNVGAGYALPSGLFLGGKLFYQYSGFTTEGETKVSSGDDSSSTYKDTTSFVAVGPSIGYTVKNGLSCAATYFPRVNYQSKSSSEWRETEEGELVDRTRTTTYKTEEKRDNYRGYQVDVGYRFSVGQADFGPQLYVTRLTYDKQTSTSKSESASGVYESDSASVDETEGTFTVTQITPVFGMWLSL